MSVLEETVLPVDQLTQHIVVTHLQVEIQRLKKKYSVRAKLEGIA